MNIIHCIGNSHVNIFKGGNVIMEGNDTIPLFKTHYIGPIIAYNFYNHHYPKALEYIQTNVNKDVDYIMFIVGEVDCRWHIPKQAEIQSKTPFELVDECLERYFKSFIDLKNLGYNLIGWGGHPSTIGGHDDDVHKPVYGNCFERNIISKYWSDSLRKKCIKHGIPFTSLVDDLIDESGLTKMEYFIDYCHLKSSMVMDMVIKQLEQIIPGLTPPVL